jgi:hypothetical protein
MSSDSIPQSVREIFAMSMVSPRATDRDGCDTGGSQTQTVARTATEILPVEIRFGLESRLNALTVIIANIEQGLPELWQTTDQARSMLDEMRPLLNEV